MKKNYKLIAGFIVLLSLMTIKLGAQCISGSQYPFGTISVPGTNVGDYTQLTTCHYSEYSVINVGTSGAYVITNSNPGDWVTIASDAAGTIIYGTGQCPFSFSLTAGIYYLHFSLTGAPNCSWASGGCRTTGLTRIPVCAGTPVTPTVSASSASICPGGATNLNGTSILEYGFSYQWYTSPTLGGSYQAIPNATNSALPQTNLTASAYYQMATTCANAPTTSTSTPFGVFVGAPPVVNTAATQTIICPNANVSLSLPYAFSGVLYAWETSTATILGQYTPVTNATLSTYTSPNNTVTAYFRAVVSCSSNPTASVVSNATTVVVQGLTTSNVPYYESFEGVVLTGQLPNCSWTQSSTNNVSTYTATTSGGNRSARTGNKFASFYANAGNTTVWTNGINMVPGITYSASMYYKTECNGYTAYNNLSMMISSAQNAAGSMTVASSNGPASSCGYKLLSGTYTVATPGVYYLGIRTAVPTQDYFYLTMDDIAIDIPCSINGPSITATGPSSVCLGSNLSITAAGANTYSWNTGASTNVLSTTPSNPGALALTVTGTNTLSNCSASLTKNVNVLAGPFISAFTSDPDNAVCPGSSAVLYAVGSAASYTWSTFGVAGANTTVSPTSNTTYTVRGTNLTNCVTEQTIEITVKEAPNVGGAASQSIICSGNMATLVGTGADTYTWTASNGSYLTGATVTPMPTAPTNYNLTGTSANGCTGTAIVAQNVVICIGIQNISGSNSNVNIYPNPTTGDFTVELSNASVSTIEITDLTGRVLSTNTTSDASVKFNINNLATGIYYVKVKSADKVEVVKVVKH